ncbi:class I SAM-dependent methyltransferase [Peteryoungia desertarenae]|uniref:Class I SAM-dependent methyltransferase n=1 Tax=Peteryoungia desertarenae TaxID=1813451 RepID=A0ABX6QN68_9HYPH|nr:class I SAM-dependent methyltransferase [Peteryoungia desertarenae]QLF70046.1 class I SAM-dependent methyltransferase [Peteryoungia desertarenae]
MRQIEISLDGQSLITPESIGAHFVVPGSTVREEELQKALAELALVLGIAMQQQVQQTTQPAEIIHRVAGSLHQIRSRYSPSVWQQLIPVAQQHPVAQFFLQDPFTRWSFEKPRGYSGDAQLLDFIYGHDSIADQIASASPVGKALYDYTKDASSSVAVRERRDLLTEYVDLAADSSDGDAEILTIAAGHLREAERSRALREKRLKRWVALDQDPLSVGAVSSEYAGTAVEAIDGSVRTVLMRSQKLGMFNLVYAAGLYDYLSDEVAIKLSQRCLQMLKPRGTFLFANFATEIVVDGYMETFMNWALLLRSEEDMWRIMKATTEGMDVECSIRFGANRNIVYGIIRKLS